MSSTAKEDDPAAPSGSACRQRHLQWEDDISPEHALPDGVRWVATGGGRGDWQRQEVLRRTAPLTLSLLLCPRLLHTAASHCCRESCKFSGLYSRHGREPFLLATVDGIDECGRPFCWVARRARKRVRLEGGRRMSSSQHAHCFLHYVLAQCRHHHTCPLAVLAACRCCSRTSANARRRP